MIRKATPNDAHILKQVCDFYNFEPRRSFDELIASGIVYIYEKSDVIGFLSVFHQHWNNTIELTNIFVKPEYKNEGYAAALIGELIKDTRKSPYRVIIAEASHDMKGFYEDHAFRECGYNDRFYDNDGSKAYFYSYDLKHKH